MSTSLEELSEALSEEPAYFRRWTWDYIVSTLKCVWVCVREGLSMHVYPCSNVSVCKHRNKYHHLQVRMEEADHISRVEKNKKVQTTVWTLGLDPCCLCALAEAPNNLSLTQFFSPFMEPCRNSVGLQSKIFFFWSICWLLCPKYCALNVSCRVLLLYVYMQSYSPKHIVECISFLIQRAKWEVHCWNSDY